MKKLLTKGQLSVLIVFGILIMTRYKDIGKDQYVLA